MEVKRLNMHVPRDLHDAFKAATAAEGRQMTDVLMEFIHKYVQQHQPERVGRRGARK
jgi:hypothetical protein